MTTALRGALPRGNGARILWTAGSEARASAPLRAGSVGDYVGGCRRLRRGPSGERTAEGYRCSGRGDAEAVAEGGA